jgi:hypothetical protein
LRARLRRFSFGVVFTDQIYRLKGRKNGGFLHQPTHRTYKGAALSVLARTDGFVIFPVTVSHTAKKQRIKPLLFCW